MLRTAAAAGVDQVLLSKHCAFAWSPKVLRAAQGAHFLTTIVEDVDLAAWATRFDRGGGHVLAHRADGRPRPVRRADRLAARRRGRQRGRRTVRALLAQADLRVTIPMPGGMESLNAAAAAAVVLFEAVRRGR